MLLSLSLVHILPEAIEAYATYLKEHEGDHGKEAGEGEKAGHGDDGDEHKHRHRLLVGRFVLRSLSEIVEKKEGEGKEQQKGHESHQGHEGHADSAFPFVFFFFVLGILIMLCLDQAVFR